MAPHDEELLRKVEVKRRILEENDRAAAALRQRFAERRMLAVNLISSPGSGKTALLEATAQRLAGMVRMVAVVGDVATDLDAQRLAKAGLPSRQVSTGGSCHLDARIVAPAIEELPEADILFIENVGNLICPTSFDLGEDAKVALLSVAEGPDKPVKYPGIFSKATLVVITKADLLPHFDFPLPQVKASILALHPEAIIAVTSSKHGCIDEWCDQLLAMLAAKRGQSIEAGETEPVGASMGTSD